MDKIKPEDRYTSVHRANDANDPARFGGYTIDCKACGRIDRRGALREAKEVCDAHEVYHQSGGGRTQLEQIKADRPIYGRIEYMDGEVAALVKDQEWLVAQVENYRKVFGTYTPEQLAHLAGCMFCIPVCGHEEETCSDFPEEGA